jgi:hypothetical protein
VEVSIRYANIEFRPGLEIEGSIWIECYDECFPEFGWADFPCAFLMALLEAIDKVLSGVASKQSVAFYDGPFEVEINCVSSDNCELGFLTREVLTKTVRFDLRGLRADALCALEEILNSAPGSLDADRNIISYRNFLGEKGPGKKGPQ